MTQPNSLRATDTDPGPTQSPSRIVLLHLSDLGSGRIAEAVALFGDRFIFEDHALGLELTDRTRLSEYFEKARELSPDATVEVISIFEHGKHVVAEWKLTATENVVYWRQLRMPIVVRGISKVRVENERITHWSDYYDGARARRASLAASFVDWVET